MSEQINISKMQVPEQLVGKSVACANLRGKFGLNIIAIESAGRVIDSIQPDYLFGSGDTLYPVSYTHLGEAPINIKAVNTKSPAFEKVPNG